MSALQHRSCIHVTEFKNFFEVIELLQFKDKVYKSLSSMFSELKIKFSDLHLTTALNYSEVCGDSKIYCAVCYENRTHLRLLLGLNLSTIIKSDS